MMAERRRRLDASHRIQTRAREKPLETLNFVVKFSSLNIYICTCYNYSFKSFSILFSNLPPMP